MKDSVAIYSGSMIVMRKLDRWIKWLYSIITMIIVILCIGWGSVLFSFQGRVDNIVYCIIGLSIIFILNKLLLKYLHTVDDHCIDKLVVRISIFATLLLYFVSFQYSFKSGWDAGMVMDNALYLVQHNTRRLEDCSWYYKMYPNNVLITCLFTSAYYLAKLIGQINGYFVLLFYQSVIFSWSGYFLYRTARFVLKDVRYSVLTWITYYLLVGLSPWITVPYSDSIGLGIVSLLMFCCAGYYFGGDKYSCRYLFAFTLLSILGFYIKPQLFIFFIAFCIIGIISSGKRILRFDRYKVKKLILAVTALIIAYLIVFCCRQFSGLTIDNESKVGIAHYLMMGVNEETNGGFNGDDVKFSQSIIGYKERCAADLVVAKRRIFHMGVPGLLRLWTRKMIINYNDGTFGWAGEGDFYHEIYTVGIPALRRLFSAFYETPHQGFYWLAQSLWMGILFLNGLSVKWKHENTMNTVKLAVLGLTLFEMLFEARARYFFCYSPCYILIAITAVSSFQLHIGEISFVRNNL